MANDKRDIEVKTFADHHVITQPNPLRKVLRRVAEADLDDPVARAEEGAGRPVRRIQELDGMSRAERLSAAHAAILQRDGFTEATRDELFRAAHDIKGDAATFGYPSVARRRREPVPDHRAHARHRRACRRPDRASHQRHPGDRARAHQARPRRHRQRTEPACATSPTNSSRTPTRPAGASRSILAPSSFRARAERRPRYSAFQQARSGQSPRSKESTFANIDSGSAAAPRNDGRLGGRRLRLIGKGLSATSSSQNRRASSRADSVAKRRSRISSGSTSPSASLLQPVSTRSTMRRWSRAAPPGSSTNPPSCMASSATWNAGRSIPAIRRGRTAPAGWRRRGRAAAPRRAARQVGKFGQRLVEQFEVARQQRAQDQAGGELAGGAQMPHQRPPCRSPRVSRRDLDGRVLAPRGRSATPGPRRAIRARRRNAPASPTAWRPEPAAWRRTDRRAPASVRGSRRDGRGARRCGPSKTAQGRHRGFRSSARQVPRCRLRRSRRRPNAAN